VTSTRFRVDPSTLEVVASGLDHPECVATGPDGRLYAGGEAGQLYRIEDDRSMSEMARLGGFVGGLALDGKGNVYACVTGKPALVRVAPDGRVEPFGRFGPGDLVEPNFPVFAADGTLFVSDSGEFGQVSGRIWAVDPSGSCSVFDERARDYTNGLAISPDGEWLYVVESAASRVVRIEMLAQRQGGRLEEVLLLPGVVPDGLAFDEEAGLYVSCYRPDRVYRLAPDGRLDIFIDDWTGVTVRAPTNVAFFGPGRSRLALSALGGYAIRAARVPVPGMPLRYPTNVGVG
jgi:gluconolactonase